MFARLLASGTYQMVDKGMLRERLAGRRIAITGATGFLGTAVAERLLRAVPDCELVLLVRAGRRSAEDRVRREILRNNCFDRLRAELGDAFDTEVARRLTVIAGDVGEDGLGLDESGRTILATCDTVIHSAATVSFDSPIDAAVEVNLLGPSRVAETLRALHRDEGGSFPHLIAVSTAYVAGSRRGDAPEATLPDTEFSTDVPWRPEVAAARRARADADSASRDPKQLAAFTKTARAELGAAGTPLLAERAERARQDWVHDRLVEVGKARAQALGWPDAYAYSKALGERALLESHGPVPVTTVRPSIIETALAEPRPGWIRGFRMADPVIISYARGLLREFPGIPEGVIDVIPVDLVVAAILAVAARGPLDQPDVFHVASGARNPMRYRQLVDLVREWFTEHPLADDKGQPIVVPEWSFPGRGRVQRQLQQATRALGAAERTLMALPLRGDQADLAARLEERRDDAQRALSYVELYGKYTETEVIFGVDRLIELWDSLPAEDQRDFCFDPGVVDWPAFVQEVYLPAVVAHARVRQATGRRPGKGATGLTREERGRRAVLSPDRHLAVFDLENTLIASNVVDSYAWLATRHQGGTDRARFVARTLPRGAPAPRPRPGRPRGLPAVVLPPLRRRPDRPPASGRMGAGQRPAPDQVLPGRHPQGPGAPGARSPHASHHRGPRRGHRTAAAAVRRRGVRPVGERGGRFTGELLDAPPTGEARAQLMAAYARTHHLDLAQSVAYADSASDLPMLEAVGHPVAVNPETKLAAIARKRGWHVEQWPRAPGAPRPLLPLGPRR